MMLNSQGAESRPMVLVEQNSIAKQSQNPKLQSERKLKRNRNMTRIVGLDELQQADKENFSDSNISSCMEDAIDVSESVAELDNTVSDSTSQGESEQTEESQTPINSDLVDIVTITSTTSDEVLTNQDDAMRESAPKSDSAGPLNNPVETPAETMTTTNTTISVLRDQLEKCSLNITDLRTNLIDFEVSNRNDPAGSCTIKPLLPTPAMISAMPPAEVVAGARPQDNAEATASVAFPGAAARIRQNLFTNLPQYAVRDAIKQLSRTDFQRMHGRSHVSPQEHQILLQIQQLESVGLNAQNYVDMLRMLIEIEDYGSQLEQNRFGINRNQTKLELLTKNHYRFVLDCNDKPYAPIVAGDRVCITSVMPHDKVNGCVTEVCNDSVIVRTVRALQHSVQRLYRITFVLNRLTLRLEQKAVERVKGFNLTPLLFPTAADMPVVCPKSPIKPIYLMDARIGENSEQMRAVRNIVHGSLRTVPYVLVGLPGTGKTQVLVECIFQLWWNQPNARILVCATSNGVVDELGLRLLECFWRTGRLGRPDMMRIYATSRLDVHPALMEYSNFGDSDMSVDLLGALQKYRIVLSTLSASGQIALIDLRPDFFTHLFIDECESAGETMQLIPIAGICSSMGRIHAQIVLAGDPQQLGPVIKSPTAKRLQYGRSMLERLMRDPMYDTTLATADAYTTKLLKNYRAHHMILKPANDFFYNGKMKAFADRHRCDLGIGLQWMPDPRFPLLFEHVPGVAQRQPGGFSWYNSMEIQRVLYYVERVLLYSGNRFQQSDIGIIAPYKNQSLRIADECVNRGWPYIKVGTVEQFQGQERTVIILSAVRTSHDKLGFLVEPKRLNVMLTRAVALLIVLGDADNLQTNPNWKMLIEYCRRNNAFIQASVMAAQQQPSPPPPLTRPAFLVFY